MTRELIDMPHSPIRVAGARQNNLQGITVRIPIGAVTVITGVAGAGKSSLAFDVLYAEGYRRYVETFSPYARQFLERLDRPEADAIDGVLPAISISRTSPVQTSRSTVGTITSIDDYLRPLFARAATLFCDQCGRAVERESPAHICRDLMATLAGQTVLLCFERDRGSVDAAALRGFLDQAGFSRVLEDGRVRRLDDAAFADDDATMTVVLDRIRIEAARRGRIMDSLESALRHGQGKLVVWPERDSAARRYSEALHCAHCDLEYSDPTPALFSFNNPIGACGQCNGFGRIIDIDPRLVIPDPRLSLADGCVAAFQTQAYSVCQREMMEFVEQKGIPPDIPWQDLDEHVKHMVWEGDPDGEWYGIRAFFDWMQSRRYRKHARIFISRFRRYSTCPRCEGRRLKRQAQLFQLGGLRFADIQHMAVGDAASFFEGWQPTVPDRAVDMLLEEIYGRLCFLRDVGLQYLSLNRQSRTLSGGETQRVTLATALGASLTSTLYVLDEPSVGLHPRDKARLAEALRTLAQKGNAVVVVEHDPAFIHAADRVIDLGPGPGRDGGKVVHQGTLGGLLKSRTSQTALYLSGAAGIVQPSQPREPGAAALCVRGAVEHNLKNIDVSVPLNLLVCVTGVSGSGKSTLIDHVIHRNLRRRKGLQVMEPGECDDLEGADLIGRPVFVDQSPLSRSSRMNAATYMKILDPLRAAFAKTDAARSMGLTASAFSFNTPAGACPHCNGSGAERVELQFLPDAYIRCPACDGKRFRPDVLTVRCRGYDIAETLVLPAQAVTELFHDDHRVVNAIRPLLDIGLGYLSLSQAAPTLSGGESQRLKLARFLAEAQKENGLLFLLDEPTTGLHPCNVADLLKSLNRLVDAGHSAVMIEHDLAVVRAADWVIDLGPEGGDAGGRIVGEGTPEYIAQLDTPTGAALRRMELADGAKPAVTATKPGGGDDKRPIRIIGAREHNLRNLSVDVPRNRFTVVTGVSGSGKSTLAFDVLYAEGRQRFLDCLPTYARQYTRPLARAEVDSVQGVPPTVALEQKVSRAGAMSTAGTVSEVYHYLRLLFAALGVPCCPRCNVAGERADASEIADRILLDFPNRQVLVLAPLIRGRKGYHKDVIAGAFKHGFHGVRVDGTLFESTPPPLDRYRVHDVEAVVATHRADEAARDALRSSVEQGLMTGAGTVLVAEKSGRVRERFYATRQACPQCGSGLPVSDPRLFVWSQKFGACPACDGSGVAGHGTAGGHGDMPPCQACEGTRLRPEALAVRVAGRNIGEIARLAVREVRNWLAELDAPSTQVSSRILPELETRLALLDELGVGYLALDRATSTLATGEAQRVRIAAELSSNLRGVCYVLDEPTVGLHPRDVQALLNALLRLRDHGNTVVVVEHEEPVIRAADHIIDLGPGAGANGGRIVQTGTPRSVIRAKDSLTGLWLKGGGEHALWRRRPLNDCGRITVRGAVLHNLKSVSVDIPLGRLVCVTGVSGSGKSTLVRDVVYRALKARLDGAGLPPFVQALDGWEAVKAVKEVDESPIGRTPRSVPATYVGAMDSIRDIFARTPEARLRGYGPSRFSFNVPGGRCEECQGQGRHKVEMPLLPVVYIPCDACDGRRYHADTLAVQYKGHSIADVLEMTVDDALDLLSVFPKARRPLTFLAESGLGYLKLGQPSPTLSGGEAQRIKLASELAARVTPGGFHVLDEPTTGLHMADVARLVGVLQRLVDRGDTVVVIEHDMDMIASADCIIDLGPEGGAAGGQVVAWGPPELVADSGASHTAEFLRTYLRNA